MKYHPCPSMRFKTCSSTLRGYGIAVRKFWFLLVLLWMTVPALGQLFADYLISPQSALTASVVIVKSTPGAFLWYSCYNGNAAQVWVQFFDSAGSPSLGTTAPTLSIPIPRGITGFIAPRSGSISYGAAAGIQVAATTTATGSSAPSSSIQCEFAYR